jgi:hypothetical protein
MNPLKSTIKDISKISDKSSKAVKGAIYYAFIPLVLYLGLKTVDWKQLTQQAS